MPLEVKFHCSRCGLDGKVEVAPRISADEDSILTWLNNEVMPKVQAAHERERP